MATLSVISAYTGIPSKKLALLERFGFDFEEDEFRIDKHHQKALDEINRNRMSPYVLAYLLQCRVKANEDEEFSDRFSNIRAIANFGELSVEISFSQIEAAQALRDTLPSAKYWVDRAAGFTRDSEAYERLARWCKSVLWAGPAHPVEYSYLATRLLFSLPYEDLPAYPKLVQTALNRVVHHGHLDGWTRRERRKDGTNRHVFFKGKLDL